MNSELQKRTVTSVFLLSLLTLMYFYKYILISALIVISSVIWYEFNALVSKISKNSMIILLSKFLSLSYIFLFSSIVWLYLSEFYGLKNKHLFLFILSVCVASDIGGLLFGKIFKGKKLTKISPNKTISGAIGSFALSISVIFFYDRFQQDYEFLDLLIITLLVSLCTQLGDLFISILKRKAKVKDTSNLLPGHGGVLDRFDGILFGIIIGVATTYLLN